ncbi:MAG TPA: DUF3040 domain-containing protein [Streptomyces sp.]|nr:DUF3040 domain-containing protein [Streptomyces sp.]
MDESPLTLRELRILRETEQALAQDAELAALFREFGEPAPALRPRRGPWLLAGAGLFLVPVLMALHPAVGLLVFFSVLAVGLAGWVNHRG